MNGILLYTLLCLPNPSGTKVDYLVSESKAKVNKVVPAFLLGTTP
jgi:hypothetical protein